MEKLIGAGCLFYALSTGNVLLNLRSDLEDDPNTWGTWGGLENNTFDESAVGTMKREVIEECGFIFDISDYLILPVVKYYNKEIIYYNYLIVIENEFTPILSNESFGFEWENLENIDIENQFPKFHPKFKKCISYFIEKINEINYSETQRFLTFDDLNESELMEAKAKSKSQRRLMAMAYAYKHGKLSEKYASPAVVKLSQLKDEFLKQEASTDQKKRKKDGSIGKRDAIPYKVRKKINKI